MDSPRIAVERQKVILIQKRVANPALAVVQIDR
jgi:hypothetical protein